jgi:GNAT superfamily N-acetyltransferase
MSTNDGRRWDDAAMEWVVEREDLRSATAATLIQALNEELSQRYPEDGANHFGLDPEEVGEGRGVFLVVRSADRPVACGAVRRLDSQTAEIKRMYVVPELRGQGIARRLLAALEAESSALGISRLVLETGDRQPDALALYERAGFDRIPAFGEYVDSPLSVCMAKRLP